MVFIFQFVNVVITLIDLWILKNPKQDEKAEKYPTGKGT